jgi:hypothetical protein
MPPSRVRERERKEDSVKVHIDACMLHLNVSDTSFASLADEDIRLFLCSRYGIKVSNEFVRDTILRGMAGSNDENESLDIMEIVAILMIPTLLKAAAQQEGLPLPEGIQLPPEGLVDYVLKIILHDVSI